MMTNKFVKPISSRDEIQNDSFGGNGLQVENHCFKMLMMYVRSGLNTIYIYIYIYITTIYIYRPFIETISTETTEGKVKLVSSLMPQ